MSRNIFYFLSAALLLLAACTTPPKNPVPESQKRTLNIQAVDIRFSPTFRLPDMTVKMERYAAYAIRYPHLASKKSGRGQLTKEYIALAMGAEVANAFQRNLRGHRPTKITLTIEAVSLSGPATTILIGRNNLVVASAQFTDLKTGAVLGTYEKFSGHEGDQGGLISATMEAVSPDGPMDDAAGAYADRLWNRFQRF